MASSTLDPEVLENLRRVAQATHKPTAQAAGPVIAPSVVLELKQDEKTKKFSEVFKLKPINPYPDFPVRVFGVDEWHPSIKERIPLINTKYHFNREALTKFMFSLHTGGAIMIYGPTGTGKTSLAEQVCAFTNRPFLRVACHKHQESDAFLGRPGIVNEGGVSVTKHHHTDTTLAAMHGGMLVIDEAFRSPILMAVQPLLENPPYLTLQDAEGIQSMLRPDPSMFSIVLTDNTNGTGDGSGSYISEAQDLSTLTRIRTAVYVDYMTEKQEVEMIRKSYPNVNEPDAGKMALVAKLIREAFVKQTIQQVMDIRALLAWAENYSYLGDLDQSFRLAFNNRLSGPDAVLVANCWRQVYGANLK